MTPLELRPPDDTDTDVFGSGQALADLLPRLRRLSLAVARDPAEAGELVEMTLADLAHSGRRDEASAFRTLVRIWNEAFAGRPARVLLADEQDSEVRSEVARLPDDQRMAVALVILAGLSYRDAAATLQVSVGTLTQRLNRGSETLFGRLDRSGVL